MRLKKLPKENCSALLKLKKRVNKKGVELQELFAKLEQEDSYKEIKESWEKTGHVWKKIKKGDWKSLKEVLTLMDKIRLKVLKAIRKELCGIAEKQDPKAKKKAA